MRRQLPCTRRIDYNCVTGITHFGNGVICVRIITAEHGSRVTQVVHSAQMSLPDAGVHVITTDAEGVFWLLPNRTYASWPSRMVACELPGVGLMQSWSDFYDLAAHACKNGDF